MGRKKKRVSSSGSGRPRSLAEGSHEEGEADVGPAVQDWLDLRLTTGVAGAKSAGNASRDATKLPALHITETDSSQLDLRNGDDAFVVIRGTDDSLITAINVCRVNVIPYSGTPRRQAASPQGPTSPPCKSLKISPGHCSLSPASFANQIVGVDQKNIDTEATTSSTVAWVPSTPSKSSPGFSFAKGGGGDLLISPKASETANKVSASWALKRASKAMGCVVVPVDTDLGDHMSMLLCDVAAQVEVDVESDSISDSTWKKAKKVIERLILATNVGRYVRVGDTIGTSFQGRTIECTVRSVVGAKANETSAVRDQLNDLSLGSKSDTENSSLIDGVRQNSSKMKLFRLSTLTQISTDVASTPPLSIETTQTNVHQVVGLDSTIERVKAFLLPPLLRPELFSEGSIRPPRGVLVYGPSGVGKSLLAQQIATALQSTEARVELVNCVALQSHTAFVGEAERKLTQLFQSLQGRPGASPSGSLLILDDVHLICPKRDGQNPGVDRLAATLLALLDGIGRKPGKEGKKGSLVVLATTTDPSVLDPALRRSGRLDAEVEVPIPDEHARSSILKYQLDVFRSEVKFPALSEDEMLDLARLAKGFNGADCMLAVKEAIRSQATIDIDVQNNRKPEVSLQDLKAAVRSTKPSTISSITVEIPQVYWSSIGGMESVKQQLREAIELPVTHAHLFEALGIPPPRGVLLFGPPGCSKTLMARALATEGQMNFLAVKGPELLSKWLGESERALASLFRRARMASPCIIFFDEIDAIAAKRGGGDGSAGGERLLSQLLTELDGVRSTASKPGSPNSERIVVVGATNRPDLLDNALMRPGRIDRKIYVGLPDTDSRERIFEIGLKDRACEDDISIAELATEEISNGFSGAELIGVCREAALFAIEEVDERDSPTSAPQIGMRHILRAIHGMQRQITPEMLDFYASYRGEQ